jgi:hypothetical protein
MRIFFKLFFFILLSIFLSAYSSNHKNLKKIEMEIFRNNELIGYNYYFFKKDKNIIQIINKVKFKVKLLGATIFDVESYGEERYEKNQLISFKSKTKQNNKEKFVNLKFDKEKKFFVIDGSSYTGTAEISNIVGNWWNYRILEAESQISPISGSIKKQIVNFISEENIKLYGKNFDSKHYKILSKDEGLPDNKKLNFDVWLDKKTGLILKVKYSKMGDWEYRLKSFN